MSSDAGYPPGGESSFGIPGIHVERGGTINTHIIITSCRSRSRSTIEIYRNNYNYNFQVVTRKLPKIHTPQSQRRRRNIASCARSCHNHISSHVALATFAPPATGCQDKARPELSCPCLPGLLLETMIARYKTTLSLVPINRDPFGASWDQWLCILKRDCVWYVT